MHQYRLYTFRDDGHFSGVQRIECVDEREAVKQARRLVNLQDGEVWERDRLIARFPERQKRPSKYASVGGLVPEFATFDLPCT